MGSVYSNITELCEQKGITASRLCADLGKPRSFMTELKSGRCRSVNTKTAEQLAEYFGCTVEQIYYGKKEETTVQPVQDVQNDDGLNEYLEGIRNRPEMRMLFQSLRGASTAQIVSVVNMIEGFKNAD